MAVVAVAGDACTTTAVALAAAWPLADDVIVIEADPAGGDLAAWFDLTVTPSLSTVVTRVLDGAWPDIEAHTRLSGSGLRLIPAPVRAGEAGQAVAESARSLVPTLAAIRSPITIVDTGRLQHPPAMHPFVGSAAVSVLVHRQSAQSARAAGVRLQRLADDAHALSGSSANLVIAVIGSVPFDVAEIATFIAGSAGAVSVVGLPVDDLSAAVYAGRTGVSSRRLARLPLARAARGLAVAVDCALHAQPGGSPRWRR